MTVISNTHERAFYAECPDLNRAYMLVGTRFVKRKIPGPCGPFCQHWVPLPLWRIALNTIRLHAKIALSRFAAKL